MVVVVGMGTVDEVDNWCVTVWGREMVFVSSGETLRAPV